jgi:hypothetical protein
MMEATKRRSFLVYGVVIGLGTILAAFALFTALQGVGCLVIRSPAVDLLLRIHVGMTESEVLTAVGKPKAIYPPERFDDAYNGWYPKPRVRADRPVWVYEVFHSIRIIVYWDDTGRVKYFDVVYT